MGETRFIIRKDIYCDLDEDASGMTLCLIINLACLGYLLQ